jgi:hypothetical protein
MLLWLLLLRRAASVLEQLLSLFVDDGVNKKFGRFKDASCLSP